MILIIGGAYQGKLDFAREAFGITDADIFTCEESSIDFSKRCIHSLEKFTLSCVREEIDPKSYLLAHRDKWKNSIFVCRDIFCGVVPMGAETREWRQITGQLVQYLSKEASQVSRIFCGLEQRLK